MANNDTTREAWRRLKRAIRWAIIEWHLERAIRLIRPGDPNARPLLEALSNYFATIGKSA